MKRNLAEIIVEEVLENLTNRVEIGQELRGIDERVYLQVVKDLVNLVEEILIESGVTP